VGIESCVLCGWQLCVDKHDGGDPTESKWVCCPHVWSVS